MPVRHALAGALVALMLGAAQPAAACAPAPPPVRDLALPRFYEDAAGSRVDPERDRAHKAAVAPLTAFLREVTTATDKAVRRRDASGAACPLAWLEAWAGGGALLGRMESRQAEYQRKWDLAGAALAYLKLRPYASEAQRKVIEGWLVRLADAATAFQLAPERKRNNHLHWLGLGLAATALAADSPRHWAAARRIAEEAAGQIGSDGRLPLEIDRGARALHYHAFAVTPLVAMAELAAGRGEDWWGLAGGALHRLVGLTIAGLLEPAVFDRLAGIAQERPSGTGAGWLALYGRRFPDRLPARLPEVPVRHRWLGGDPLLLPIGRPASGQQGTSLYK